MIRAMRAALAPFGTTIFTEMTRRANETGAINLAQGFPDFDGPELAKEAAVAAIRAGRGQYAPMSGAPELTAALARLYRDRYGLDYAASTELTVTSGATEAIASSLLGLVEPGDEVVLFEPYYDSYRACVAMAGGVPRFVSLEPPDWTFDDAALAAAIGPRTRVLVLNSPHNPTGKVFSRDELERIAAACRAHDLTVVADEVYERLVFEGTHVPIATLPGMRDRTVTISSFGKTYSLTGWKIGWAAAPPPLTAAVRAAHQFVTFATATPLQHAVAATLAEGEAYVAGLVASYRLKRDRLVDALRATGFDVRPPAGTYFIAAGFGPLGWDDDVAFCRHLLEEIGVAAIPPSVFCERKELGRSWVRFAFCKRDETLDAAIARLARLTPRTPPR